MGNDWDCQPLESIASFSQGFQAPTEDQFFEPKGGLSRFVRIVDFTNALEPPRYIKTPSKRYFIEPDDIVMIRYGSQTAGRVVRGKTGVLANNMFKISLGVDFIHKGYLFHYLTSPSILNFLTGSQSSSTMPAITFGMLEPIQINFPSKTEQARIAAYIDSLDDKIELNRRMNETLEGMAQALFKSWFVDFDPVIDNALAAANPIPEELADRAELRSQALANGTANCETAKHFPDAFQFTEELGWIPEGWEVGKITDLAELNSESWSNKNHPNHVEYIDLANTKNGRINEVFPYDFSAAPSRARRVLKEDDSIIGTVRPGNCSFAYIHQNGLTGSTGFAVLRPMQKTSRVFIYLSLTQDEAIENFAHLADGGAYPAIRPEVVGNRETVIFDSDLMSIFDEQCYPWIAKIGQQQKEAETLSKLRDILLPKLISGEFRIADNNTSMEMK
ncbi:MAG: restriction endonuclease subunit S [Candidatus Scalindua sp.]|nr:restriction endonuclease subunit S [Bacteroidota bacterium]MBT5531170.1 restriction endonuclease subunit S [Cytophagia bacterium]MBT6226668.1 restriction endonuclease subunit S [Candidatus Scalindua sp.]